MLALAIVCKRISLKSMLTEKMNLFNLHVWCLLLYFVGRTRQVYTFQHAPIRETKHAKIETQAKGKTDNNKHNSRILIQIGCHQPIKIDFPMKKKKKNKKFISQDP